MVLALAGLLAVAACSATPEATSTPVAAATPAPTTSLAPPAITPGEAVKVFAEYVATDDLLRAGGDLRLALDLVSGAQAQLTLASYQATGYHPPRYTWGPPTLLVPRLQGNAPAWFSVLTKRGDRQAVLTFAKSPDWRLSSATLFEPGVTVPEVELDASGYATALSPDDTSVLINPKFMPSLHATVAEAGPTGITAGLIAPGPYTTQMAAQIAQDRAKAKSKDGYIYDSIFTAGDYPIYALRTKDGGALIQYSLTRTSTTTNKADLLGAGIPIPQNIQWLIPEEGGGPKLTAQKSIKIIRTEQFAATIPPASTTTGQAAVIAYEGALTRATAS